MSDAVHPILLRASVRGLNHNEPHVIEAALLFDAIVDRRRIDDDGWTSHVAGSVLDVALAADPAAVRNLAGTIYMVDAWPQELNVAGLTTERFTL